MSKAESGFGDDSRFKQLIDQLPDNTRLVSKETVIMDLGKINAESEESLTLVVTAFAASLTWPT